MFRKPVLAALALALMSSAALAQNASDTPNGPPAQLYGGADDRDGPPPPPPPPPGYSSDNRAPADAEAQDQSQEPPPGYSSNNRAPADAQAQDQSQDQRSRDIFCRRDAAARTGYMTPGEAASHEQTAGSVGGAVTGAALGAIIGGASHAAGPGALIGAGAGLIAGTAIGSDNAKYAAADVQRAYSDAYYACMDEADDRGPPPGAPGYAYGPPPPAYYAPYPYYYPPYYYGPGYYGPGVSFGFRVGPGFRGGFRGFHR
jgi:outer membrane lipoprotein SlyB